MGKTKHWVAAFGFGLAASSCAFASVAADNVQRSAVPPNDRFIGNECTDRSIKPFARPKDSALSDDVLRAALTLVKGMAGATDHMGVTSVCGERSAM
ncbi:hypothetical protein M0D69_00745 [Caballeronia sp. SEWSISQ10-4 2]|uniref:hypothetical protein n=1 Tax=Caballeronia sp. SEWSISQ10-4 2 TaxID=2937438 RepID=UPI002650244E|nr:hypothetical protein [Caballeronia sp. SEWSISQ10-4 2]MDN7176572.1 hypothetical protein [Caballeronia sp. SEWSISQ10-4 2]